MHNYILDTISQIAVRVAPSRVEVPSDDRLPSCSTGSYWCVGTGWSTSRFGTMRSMAVYRILLLITTLEVSAYVLLPISRGATMIMMTTLFTAWGWV